MIILYHSWKETLVVEHEVMLLELIALKMMMMMIMMSKNFEMVIETVLSCKGYHAFHNFI